jgi:copper transport protein
MKYLTPNPSPSDREGRKTRQSSFAGSGFIEAGFEVDMIGRRWILIVVTMVIGLTGIIPASAHANLLQANPAPNAILDSAPAEIRMSFSEPLEPDFSAIKIRDKDGALVDTPASAVDRDDPKQMALVPGDLPDGLYTISWRVVSAADGHPTLGSYAFIVGAAAGGFGNQTQATDILPVDGIVIRWLHLISLAMAVGGLGFMMFVWNPAVTEANPAIEKRMGRVILIGWIFIGLTSFLLTALLYSVATDNPLFTNINLRSLEQLIADTRFGHLRLAFTALWIGMGLSLWFARGDKWFQPVALVLGIGMLLTHSLFSHANAAQDLVASVGADWLHLTATALWVGGLVQFVNVIGPVRKNFAPAAPVLSRLVAHFTNFARVSVAALIVTGLYSAWLQVGSVEGLLTTPYGQVLLVKILLIIPLIGIAAINLFYTYKGLNAGQEIWGKRLRGLVGVEIVLMVGILAAVGMMTSIAPARTTLALRASAPKAPEPAPIIETLSNNDLNVELTISPGWVGENTFSLKVTDTNGAPVTNATLIRMKFESQTQNLGESELRPTHQGDGIYTINGANLSVPGEWRIRTTVQRPDQFDALVDFKPSPPLAPLPIQPPPPDPNAPLPYRSLALLAAGILALVIGGFFLGENRLRPPRASSLLAVGLLIAGGALLFSGVKAMGGATVAASAPYDAPDDAPIKLAITSNNQNPLPYLVTAGGDLLQPGDDQIYRRMPIDARVRDVYVDHNTTLWASADDGFYEYVDGEWNKLENVATTRTILTHGYFFALATGGMIRVPAGGGELEKPRQIKTPLADQATDDLVMLGNHTHVIQSGGQVFQTKDLGLSWTALNAPQPIGSIGTDANGNLLAVSADGVRTWDFAANTWSAPTTLPTASLNPLMRIFDGLLFGVVDGQLYRRSGSAWQTVALPDSDGAYLTDLKNDVVLTDLEFQYPTTLWALDAKGRRLWTTTNGDDWRMIPIKVS